jgi:hypothetical protein
MTAPTCAVCGASLEGRRATARFCGPPCRAEASRVRRVLEGEEADGYRNLAGRREASRRRTRRLYGDGP